jgi:hypothetical protein
MNKQNELNGIAVLVKPTLIDDPDNKKNQVGVIVMTSVEDDNVMVSFGLNDHSFFPTDALLILRKPDNIRRDAQNDFTQLPFYDYADIISIVELAESSSRALRDEAVVLAMKSPDVLEYTMVSLSTELGIKRNPGISYGYYM